MPVTRIDTVFKALADPSRRELLDRLHARSGLTLTELCSGLDMTRQAVTQHLAVLQEANLVAVRRQGREKLHYFNPVPIHMIHDRWTTEFSAYWAGGLARMKYRLENAPVPITKNKGGKRG